jgi:hypothetical protein
LALKAGEWLRLGLLGIFAAPPWSCASEQYHLSGCPVSPGHFCLKVTPGITGLWQVSGRSGLNFDDMVRLDRLYIENWSLSLDLSILLKTVRVVLGRRGAW